MTHPFTTKQLPFFLTAASDCPYLPGLKERKVFTKLEPGDGPALNDALTHAGFRRSQSILYRPACERCALCKSARIPVARFEPSRTQRRIARRCAELTREPCEPVATVEQFDLLARYLSTRHCGGEMAGMDFIDFASMVEDGAQRTEVVEYRDGTGALVAAALVDELSDGYSLVYSFFDPERAGESLGAYMILDHVERAAQAGLAHVYLGYWVKGSMKMDYKAAYRPLEILEPSGWRLMSEDERAAQRTRRRAAE